jgi:hypothetical protein
MGAFRGWPGTTYQEVAQNPSRARLDVITGPMGRQRTIIGFLVAPLIVPFVFYLPFPGTSDVSSKVSVLSLLITPLIYSVFAIPIAYVVEFFLGLPAWTIYRRYGVRSVSAFAGGGALIGLAFYAAVETVTYVFSPDARQLRREFNISANPLSNPFFYVDVVSASASAVLFRTIVFWGNGGESSK